MLKARAHACSPSSSQAHDAAMTPKRAYTRAASGLTSSEGSRSIAARNAFSAAVASPATKWTDPSCSSSAALGRPSSVSASAVSTSRTAAALSPTTLADSAARLARSTRSRSDGTRSSSSSARLKLEKASVNAYICS